MKKTAKESEILKTTKEFAITNNVHYDDMTESMILNAIREVNVDLADVSQQRELLIAYEKKSWMYFRKREGKEIEDKVDHYLSNL